MCKYPYLYPFNLKYFDRRRKHANLDKKCFEIIGNNDLIVPIFCVEN